MKFFIFNILFSVLLRIWDLVLMLILHTAKIKIYFDLHFFLKQHYEKYNVRKMLQNNALKRKHKRQGRVK